MIESKRQMLYRYNLLRKWETDRSQIKLITHAPDVELARLIAKNKMVIEQSNELLRRMNLKP